MACYRAVRGSQDIVVPCPNTTAGAAMSGRRHGIAVREPEAVAAAVEDVDARADARNTVVQERGASVGTVRDANEIPRSGDLACSENVLVGNVKVEREDGVFFDVFDLTSRSATHARTQSMKSEPVYVLTSG
jgi:hypothetical protein